MAAEHGMIEPSEAGQVREADGRKLISYGTSSYGYDVRCSDEFKVFTNVHSAIVDPKNSILILSLTLKLTILLFHQTRFAWRVL